MKSRLNYYIFVMLLITCLVFILSASAMAQTSNDNFLKELKGLAIKPDGKPLKVGIVFGEFSSEFAIALGGYPKWLLEQAGAEVTLVNADYDLELQQNTLDDFVVMGVDVIIIQPVDDFAIAAKVNRIQAKGIPVMALNHPPMDKDGNIIVSVAGISPNIDMAASAANYIVEKAAGKDVKVAEIIGDIKQVIAQVRAAGFKEAVEKNPNLKYVNSRVTDWGPEGALTATEDFITADPDLFAIFAQSDGMLPGVVAALKRNEKLYPVGDPNHIIIVSIDGAPYAHQAIREGWVDMSMEQSPYAMASIVVKAALMVAQGIKLPEIGEGAIEPATVKITAENVDMITLWGNYGKPHDEVWPNTLEVWKQYRFAGDEAILDRFK